MPAGAQVTLSTFSGVAANTFDTVRLTFSAAINPATFTTGDVTSLTDPNGASIAVSNVLPVLGTTDQFDVTFPAQSTLGTYTITLGVDIRNLTAEPMDQNQNGTNAEPGIAPVGDEFQGSAVLLNPADTSGANITDAVFSGTAANTFDKVRLTFSETIQASTFSAADITLTGPGGTVTVANVTPVSGSSGKQFDVTFAAQATAGTYTIHTGVNILDLGGTAGNKMNQNGNATNGEAGVAPAGDEFQLSADLFNSTDLSGANITTAAFSGTAANTFDKVRLTFSEAIQASTFGTADVTLNGPGGAITATNVVAVSGSSGKQFDVTFAPQSTVGVYTVHTGVDILDFGGASGNKMNQNGNATNGEAGLPPTGDEFEATGTLSSSSDTTGASITKATFSGTTPTAFDNVRITFNEPMDAASFTAADVSLTGPNGTITATSVVAVGGSGTKFDVSFPSQSAAGTYTLTTGVDILDLAGNKMNQNGNATNGEAGVAPAGDQFQANANLFDLADLSGANITTAAFSGTAANTFDKVRLTFSEAIQASTFGTADVTLNGPGGAITATNVVAVSGSSGKQFDVTFAPQSVGGKYTVHTGVDILDFGGVAGNQMNQNGNALNGEAGLSPNGDEFEASDTLITSGDTSGASITNAAFSTPGGPFDKVTLTFNEAIQPTSFDATDVSLTGPNGAITVANVAEVAGSNGKQFDVTFASQSAAGTYTLTTGVNILDLAGNKMNQNGNTSNGEAGLPPAGDQFQTSADLFNLADLSGASVTTAAFSGTAANTFDKVRLTFSEAIQASTFSTTDVTLNGPGGAITATNVTEVSGSNGKQFDVTFASQSTAGVYTVHTGVDILDFGGIAGNTMNQNGNALNGEAGLPPNGDEFEATGTLTISADTSGASITNAAFSTPGGPFDKVTLTFSEAMDVATFTAGDVSLMGPGGVISATGVAEVAGSNGTQFDVSFTSQSAVGTYTLITGVDILDLAGNQMNQNGNSSNGEAGVAPAGDQFSASASISTAAPGILALGQSNGSVKILNAATGAVIVQEFRPFDANSRVYTSLVAVALGDINGDGIDDLFVAPTKRAGIAGLDASKAGKIFVYNGADLAQGIANAANVLDTFTPFATPFGGVTNPDGTTAYQTGFELTTGDINGDGVLDLVAASRGDVGQVSVQSTANGHAQIGAIVTPYGTNYRGKVGVTTGNFIDEANPAQRDDEIATSRGNTDNPTASPGVSGTTTRAAMLDLVGTTLTQITFSGAISSTGVPFGIAGTGGQVIDRNAFVEAVDTDGNGIDELLFAARDFVSDSNNPHICIAVYSISTSGNATGLANYRVGDQVGSYSIDHHGETTGTDTLVMAVDGPSAGVLFLAPLTGEPTSTLPTTISVLAGGNRIASV